MIMNNAAVARTEILVESAMEWKTVSKPQESRLEQEQTSSRLWQAEESRHLPISWKMFSLLLRK